MTSPVQIPQAWTPHLRWAFGLIIGGFVLTYLISIKEMQNTQTNVQLIVERALRSIELASELSREIDQKRLLFDAHIVETDGATMKQIEEQIANADARISATIQAYEPTIIDDAERATWQEVQRRIAAVQPKIAKILDLSRERRGAEARAAMKNLEPEFHAIDQAAEALTRINHAHADSEMASIQALQGIAIIVLTLLAAATTVFALLTARWVTRLVTQRESQMRDATAQLEEHNRELDAFAGRVAHDLRSPLTAINLAAFAMQETSDDVTTGVFRRSVRQMETIIQDLLTLSRISAEISGASCQTAAVAASLEEDLRPQVEAVGGVARIHVAAATVSCSEGLLRQVLWNLGENAVKYRRPGVCLEVEIRGRVVPHAYEFNISDNGSGMSATEVQHVFDAFYRGEQAQSTPGTGLGLSIVKRVVEASGGSISVHSVPGRGTTFKIILPLAISKAA
jgi:signal transduction histidine kinase